MGTWHRLRLEKDEPPPVGHVPGGPVWLGHLSFVYMGLRGQLSLLHPGCHRNIPCNGCWVEVCGWDGAKRAHVLGSAGAVWGPLVQSAVGASVTRRLAELSASRAQHGVGGLCAAK